MACMCGDTHCFWCGPAQGNSRCPICHAWADDGCEHFNEDTGELKPEFAEEARRLVLAEQQREAAEFVREMEEERLGPGWPVPDAPHGDFQ